jgi:hypothetical protein
MRITFGAEPAIRCCRAARMCRDVLSCFVVLRGWRSRRMMTGDAWLEELTDHHRRGSGNRSAGRA